MSIKSLEYFLVFCQKNRVTSLYPPFLWSVTTFNIFIFCMFSLSSKLSRFSTVPFSTFCEEHQHFKVMSWFISSLLSLGGPVVYFGCAVGSQFPDQEFYLHHAPCSRSEKSQPLDHHRSPCCPVIEESFKKLSTGVQNGELFYYHQSFAFQCTEPLQNSTTAECGL